VRDRVITKLAATKILVQALVASLLTVAGCETAQLNLAQNKVPKTLVSPTLAFENGRWFNGQRFASGPQYCVNSVFTSVAPETVDLSGQYVIPPLAEAHTLHFDNPGIFNVVNAMSLQ
jgi:hypothetical protein